MKNQIKPLLKGLPFVLLFTFFFHSCTIQKRTFNKGYFVQWNWDKKVKNTNYLEKENQILTQNNTENSEEIVSETNVNQEQILITSDVILDEKSEFISPNKIIENQKRQNTSVKSQKFSLKKINSKILKAFIPKSLKKASPPMDGELAINIVLTVVFLVASILFFILAHNAFLVPSMLLAAIYGVVCLVAFIIFITQVIDLIMW